ncbi:MAG: hypothetical protein FD146_1402 [Anaerolineaceae bacterium]|nr:MAG: hypothetical protein FD146_1402 [Anaerolineaceae bacterium]
MRRDEAYLLDILLSARRALKHVEGLSWETFETDELMQDAVMRPLEIMGEAAGHISEDFREAHPNIPWHKIIGIRNQLIHEYFRINRKTVWDTIKNDLPNLIWMIEPLVPGE